ncbi:hypothetical protein LSTR_LSTR015392 [Laodelphax striatellus]|uniref:Arrestin-like N-terminal domain-containing protein n=1 Tax=Laodelphax striatellus TaxID=195883 RepID=A0A482XPJ2_LAOST|nr:hypothetical protein LSTR_LSTR015392 [Laodelphax striatellus]
MRFSTETYFDKRDILFGHNYSSYREHLPAGTHCLPFAFTLPANLPSSYVGRHAFIHYYCEALIERWNKPSVAEKVFFTVSEVLDLNNDPRADVSLMWST